jgi:PucR family transcriptional regulator, proline-responsive transcriptional activator
MDGDRMITVFDIVTSPNFEHFQIISGEKGIQNPVSGTGIFDWESKSDIAKTFRKGEFVITTLSIAKDDFEYANDCIKTLILHGVSAICIKEVFFRNLSEDTIQKSDILGVPIFFFSDTYVDDIVYDVRNLLASDKGALRSNLAPALKEALEAWYTTGVVPSTTENFIEEKVHPYLQDFTRCVVAFPKNGKPLTPNMQPIKTSSDERSIIIPYESGILVILSSPNAVAFSDSNVRTFIESIHVPFSSCWLGASLQIKGTRQIVNNILEAFLACASAMLKHDAGVVQNTGNTGNTGKNVVDAGKTVVDTIETFQPSNVENLLISNCWSQSSRQYFLRIDQVLASYDQEHGSDLLGTLSAYIEANGDLVSASKMLFQHANTVRYRVAKIKSLLEIDTPSSYLELFVFVKLMEIYETFEKTFCLQSNLSNPTPGVDPDH